jgi:DNA-binding CsgD family transcriptional regulator
MLIERDAELLEIERSLARARSGEGSTLLFEGPAGIGKTTLLTAARERAQRDGMHVIGARGGELEGKFPYGVVRQLLEPAVRSATQENREQLLSGAASLAAPAVLGAPTAATGPVDHEFAIVRGLYWLVANFAAESPLALVIDDAHWSDTPSLQFLTYLARRLDGLPVAIIGSVRTGDGAAAPLLVSQLEASPGARIERPSLLSEAAVAALLELEFGTRPDPDFARACGNATGGNPFLVRELAAALIADGIQPVSASTARLASTGPSSIARATLTRLGNLSADAVELARAIAVLGGDSTLPRAAVLAGVDERAALASFDALVVAGVARKDGRLEFSHPVVRTAIYEDLAPGRRSLAHRRVAEMLAAEGAELDAIGGHLLLCEPSGSMSTIETLRAAAAHALALGAPESAATYLARALDEGCERELRASLMLELAGAEHLARGPGAVSHYEEVRRLATDPITLARAMVEQAHILIYAGIWEPAGELFDQAIAVLGDLDPALTARAEVTRATMTAFDPRLKDSFERRIPELRELAARDHPVWRPLSLLLANVDALRGAPADEVVAQVERGWDGGRFLTDGAEELLPQAISAFVLIDRLEQAETLVGAVQLSAQETGSILRFLVARAHSAWIHARRGNLASASAEMRDVFEIALERGIQFGVFVTLWYCADVLLERPDADDLAALVEQTDLGPLAEVTAGAQLLEVRGRLRFAAGRTQDAIDDLRAAGAILSGLSFNATPYGSWRSTLAGMLGPSHHEARAFVAEELTQMRRADSPRGVGIALRRLATLEGADDGGRAYLEESVAILAQTPARLEHARSLVELGALLRRHGHRAASREPLRDGLDLATRCGAIRLAERAGVELAATGARPRRARTSGRDALTPSELRVAQMAAEGRTSRDIAQALFVTTKTIEVHLQHAYSKLDINSRTQLAKALARAPED